MCGQYLNLVHRCYACAVEGEDSTLTYCSGRTSSRTWSRGVGFQNGRFRIYMQMHGHVCPDNCGLCLCVKLGLSWVLHINRLKTKLLTLVRLIRFASN